MQPAHCLPDACVVGTGPGLASLPSVSQYSDYVTTVTSHHQAAAPEALTYSATHPASAVSDFATSAMYVNTVWGDQPNPHSQPPPGVYYESYPPYGGYPGHMIPGQDGSLPPGYPGMPGGAAGAMVSSRGEMEHHMTGPGGKRKRRRVITYEQRKAANVRERKRMCHLNDAFDVLRKRVPTFAYEKKLSRIETLKLAVTYIQYMAELLEQLDDDPGKEKKCSQGVGTPESGRSDGSADDDEGMTSKDSSHCSPCSMHSDSKENSPAANLVTLMTMASASEHLDPGMDQQQQHQSQGVIAVASHETEGPNVTVEVVTGGSEIEICSSQQPQSSHTQQVIGVTTIVASPLEPQAPLSVGSSEEGRRMSPPTSVSL